MILIGCSKNDDGESDKPNNNGNEQPENPNEPKLPELSALPDPDDVCSAMDDLKFMAYCYEKFEVNKDGKVSETEANAVRIISIDYRYPVESLKGIERFPNIEIFRSGDRITELDLRYNLKLEELSCYGNGCLTTVLLPNTLTVNRTLIRLVFFANSVNIQSHSLCVNGIVFPRPFLLRLTPASGLFHTPEAPIAGCGRLRGRFGGMRRIRVC